MYSTVALLKNSKHSGRLVGTHQKIDKIARKCLEKHLRVLETKNGNRAIYFPTAQEIIYFEGVRGPDGIKRKSPGIDEPSHFIVPEKPETHAALLQIIHNHEYNLHKALQQDNDARSAFEAAWLAHALTDGLTPAHHFPLKEATTELMSDKEFIKIFGTQIKGIMRGEDFLATVRNNWRYWGTNGYMSKHIAFEYGVAIVVTAVPNRNLMPVLTEADFAKIDLGQEFMRTLYKIHSLDMYNRFRLDGWSAELARETANILIPEIIRIVTLAWAAGLESERLKCQD